MPTVSRGSAAAYHKILSAPVSLITREADANFREVFDAIKKLMMPPVSPKTKIGFVETKKKK